MYNIGDKIIFYNAVGMELFGRITGIWHRKPPITYEVFCLGESFLVKQEHIIKKISAEEYERLLPKNVAIALLVENIEMGDLATLVKIGKQNILNMRREINETKSLNIVFYTAYNIR